VRGTLLECEIDDVHHFIWTGGFPPDQVADGHLALAVFEHPQSLAAVEQVEQPSNLYFEKRDLYALLEFSIVLEQVFSQ